MNIRKNIQLNRLIGFISFCCLFFCGIFIILINNDSIEIVNAAISDDFSVGSGTEESPYEISTAEQLQALNKYLGSSYRNVYYEITNDIDLTSYLSETGAGYNSGAGWNPIGRTSSTSTYTYMFQSKLNGNNFVIKGLWLNRGSLTYVGLFGAVYNTTIKNLGVEVSEKGITGASMVGGFSGMTTSATVDNCYAKGDITSKGSYSGGFIAYCYNGSVSNCYFDGNVTGTSYVGGFVGWIYGTIENCYSIGTVKGSSYVGGFAGASESGFMFSCYSTSHVTGSSRVGGFIGHLYYSTARQCYSFGDVTGTNYVGGCIGYSSYSYVEKCYAVGDVVAVGSYTGGFCGYYYSYSMKGCYSSGNVSGITYVGGFIGRGYGPITNCYSVNNIEGTDYIGGFVGYMDGALENNYYVGKITIKSSSNANPLVNGFVGWVNSLITNCYHSSEVSGYTDLAVVYDIPDDELKMRSTFVKWDFDNIWRIAEGQSYPSLIDLLHVIKFETYEGTPDVVDNIQFDNNTAKFNLPVLTKDDCVFYGWKLKEDLTGDTITNFDPLKYPYSMTLHADFGQWKVKLDNSGADESGVAEMIVFPNIKTEDIMIPKKKGYEFLGYYSQKNGSGIKYVETDGSIINEITTSDINILYANWSACSYFINYETNGGTEIEQDFFTYDIEYELKETSRVGYTFGGWFENSNLSGEAITTIPVNNGKIGDRTFYAGWTAIKYSITYITNGGNRISSEDYSYGSEFILPIPIKAGYIFKGWYDNFSLSGEPLEIIEEGSMENLELYAKWILDNIVASLRVDNSVKKQLIIDMITAVDTIYIFEWQIEKEGEWETLSYTDNKIFSDLENGKYKYRCIITATGGTETKTLITDYIIVSMEDTGLVILISVIFGILLVSFVVLVLYKKRKKRNKWH